MEKENSQLQNLMSYTVFHIGVYISLLAVILSAGMTDKLNVLFFKIPFICYLIAGICGGVIASNIPEYSNFEKFATVPLRIWGIGTFKYKVWAFFEHFIFWIGTLWIACTFIFGGTEYFRYQQ